ncbi:hypothetical protein KI387_016737, partial [Taxus chinensis]
VAYYCTGTYWGATGAVSPGTGSGTAIGTSTTIGPSTGIGSPIGTGCTGMIGATTIRSRGTSPSSHGGTDPLYGGESEGP